MYQGKGFRRPELEASETRNIQLFRRLSSKELLLLRVVVLAFLTLLVNVALTMADSGRVELKASRLNFSLSGDTLWAGYGWSEKDFPNLVKYADPVARVSR
ncbi:hypothetical protein [Stutzerimonas nitrititolerans]|uniref:hypothetical protein n=1 Tax=Stutzerimonas nitrititolerans TaxID=2482751 RepID=UPI001483701A|nr:hypothetical protein [Stutzerimonas nitrititolerans]NNT96098.1 hypothetical protein [Stutzerimonas nitrititolerans]